MYLLCQLKHILMTMWISIIVPTSDITDFDLMTVGHHAMVGTLNPPSNVVCFPHNKGPLLPAK